MPGKCKFQSNAQYLFNLTSQVKKPLTKDKPVNDTDTNLLTNLSDLTSECEIFVQPFSMNSFKKKKKKRNSSSSFQSNRKQKYIKKCIQKKLTKFNVEQLTTSVVNDDNFFPPNSPALSVDSGIDLTHDNNLENKMSNNNDSVKDGAKFLFELSNSTSGKSSCSDVSSLLDNGFSSHNSLKDKQTILSSSVNIKVCARKLDEGGIDKMNTSVKQSLPPFHCSQEKCNTVPQKTLAEDKVMYSSNASFVERNHTSEIVSNQEDFEKSLNDTDILMEDQYLLQSNFNNINGVLGKSLISSEVLKNDNGNLDISEINECDIKKPANSNNSTKNSVSYCSDNDSSCSLDTDITYIPQPLFHTNKIDCCNTSFPSISQITGTNAIPILFINTKNSSIISYDDRGTIYPDEQPVNESSIENINKNNSDTNDSDNDESSGEYYVTSDGASDQEDHLYPMSPKNISPSTTKDTNDQDATHPTLYENSDVSTNEVNHEKSTHPNLCKNIPVSPTKDVSVNVSPAADVSDTLSAKERSLCNSYNTTIENSNNLGNIIAHPVAKSMAIRTCKFIVEQDDCIPFCLLTSKASVKEGYCRSDTSSQISEQPQTVSENLNRFTLDILHSTCEGILRTGNEIVTDQDSSDNEDLQSPSLLDMLEHFVSHRSSQEEYSNYTQNTDS